MKIYACQRSSWSDLSEDKYGPSGKLMNPILLHMSVPKISRGNNIRAIDNMHEAFNSFPRWPVFNYALPMFIDIDLSNQQTDFVANRDELNFD